MTKRERLLGLITKAITGTETELEKIANGKEAVDGLNQLKFILSKLCSMKEVLEKDEWNPATAEKPGISRLVIDTWPLKDPLGELIADIEYQYCRK